VRRDADSHTGLLKRRWFRHLSYRFTRDCLIRPLGKRYFEMHISGRENIPEEPCVVATHHCLSFDWALLGFLLDKKAHGWIDTDIFGRVKGLASLLELIPVNTGGGPTSREDYRTTREISRMWLENTDEVLVIVTDGPSKHCIDADGGILPIAERPSHSGAAGVAAEADVAVVPYASWVPDPHGRALFSSKGVSRDLRYLERNRKIPYWGEFAAPIRPGDVAGRHELRDEIRRVQVATWERLRMAEEG
jgi:1-acyl-sn-glycerol-3-phosphate acyltransferase